MKVRCGECGKKIKVDNELSPLPKHLTPGGRYCNNFGMPGEKISITSAINTDSHK